MILWSKISSFILMSKVSQFSFLYRCHQTLCDQSEAGWGSVRDGMERRRSCQTHFSLHLRGNRVAHCPRSEICFQNVQRKIRVTLLHGGNGLVMRDNFCISKEMQRLSWTSEKEYCFFCYCDYKSYICVMIDRALSSCVDGLRIWPLVVNNGDASHKGRGGKCLDHSSATRVVSFAVWGKGLLFGVCRRVFGV